VSTLSVLALGCGGIGPSGISGGRHAYNAAIQTTSNEEMLLNIVRLRYRDTPFFLQVSGVAANVSTQMGLNGSAQIPSRGPTIGTVGATALLEDNPTVTYSPLQGDDFVTHFLTPVRLETLQLLIETGWSIDRVLRLCVQRLGDAKNAPSASGPTPDRAPEFERFRRASMLLRILEKRDAISFSIEPTTPLALAMDFRENEANSAEALELAEILQLEPGARRFVFSTRRETDEKGRLIPIETRSLMGSLFYLSQAIHPPEQHVKDAWVTVTRNADGSDFDWNRLMDGLFTVSASSAPPSSAFLSTNYLGHVFSIDQSDLNTKATFVLLNQLFALQAGSSSATGPLLTLPVSR
jgi:hypothetical protein